MRILALETSAKSVSAAVCEGETVLAFSYCNTGLTHSRTLMPMVDGMLKNAGIPLSDISLIAVAAGPGSFTGLRIGVSAAKGLAWSLGLPCCAVSTLEAMARNVSHMNATVICAMDARRNQIYNAVFSASDRMLKRLTPDRAISLQEFILELKNDEKQKIVVGDGASICYTFLREHGVSCTIAPPELVMQNAVGVAFAAEEMEKHGCTVSAHDLRPNYLRLSQAERERLAKGLSITLD